LNNATSGASTLWCQKPPYSLSALSNVEFPEFVAERLVAHLAQALTHGQHAVLCPSAGRTVTPVYRALRRRFADALDWGRVICVQMDEYEGVAPECIESFASQLLNELVLPLGVGRFLGFNDSSGRPRLTHALYERQLMELGGIDVALHGIGVNGHVGFNEPSSPQIDQTRSTPLHPCTQAANDVLYSRGHTLGISALRAARTSLVAISGTRKRAPATQFLFGPITPSLPVSLLRSANALSIFIDEDASPLRR
jgi:glucosamine-6-phosphate deaminase